MSLLNDLDHFKRVREDSLKSEAIEECMDYQASLEALKFIHSMVSDDSCGPEVEDAIIFNYGDVVVQNYKSAFKFERDNSNIDGCVSHIKEKLYPFLTHNVRGEMWEIENE